MSLAGVHPGDLTAGPQRAREWFAARADRLLTIAVGAWMLSGSVVITEPSPYELAFIVVALVSVFAGGFAFRRRTLGLVALWLAFMPFALLAAFQPKYTATTDALIFQSVTIFLFFTAVWVAAYVAEAPIRRMQVIVRCYTITAVVAALLGTLGYLSLIPGHDVLTLYGRAKALFNDPNVFGPFLILPAMYALQRVLLAPTRQSTVAAGIFIVLVVGVFASFSRAAWGHLFASAVLVYVLCFFAIAHAREKARMLMIALVGTLAIVVAIGGMLSIPQVQRLFEVRAQAQSYDEGDGGRFGRQGYAFELAVDHPAGMGPYEFRNLRIKEEPHNSYVNVVHVYGWGGGAAFILLIVLTIWRGLSFVARPSPHRLLLIPLISVFIPLAVEAAIIDLDHWRHFFLVAGLIWGVTAGYWHAPKGTPRLAALI